MEDQQKITTPPQVTTKDPKKVEAGKKLAEYNKKKHKQLKQQQEQEQSNMIMSYISNSSTIGIGIGIFAIIGVIVYYNSNNKNTTK